MTKSVCLEVVMFVMPWELDGYERAVDGLLAAASAMRPRDRLLLDVVFGVSPGIVTWEESGLSADPLVKRFNAISAELSGRFEASIRVDREGETLGCCDHRRQHSSRARSGSTVIWLDPDVVFPHHALATLGRVVSELSDSLYVLTPQLPRMWDDTWDCLVHNDHVHGAIGSCFSFDTRQVHEGREDAGGSIRLRRLPEFKFGGGWLTALSADLVQLVEIPRTFRPYGEEDTYVMRVCSQMANAGWPVRQHVLEGMLVAQDYTVSEESAVKGDLALVQDRQANVRYNRSITEREVRVAMARIGSYEGNFNPSGDCSTVSNQVSPDSPLRSPPG